jgi:hypothetical protein
MVNLRLPNDFGYISIPDGILLDSTAARKVFCQGRSVPRSKNFMHTLFPIEAWSDKKKQMGWSPVGSSLLLHLCLESVSFCDNTACKIACHPALRTYSSFISIGRIMYLLASTFLAFLCTLCLKMKSCKRLDILKVTSKMWIQKWPAWCCLCSTWRFRRIK